MMLGSRLREKGDAWVRIGFARVLGKRLFEQLSSFDTVEPSETSSHDQRMTFPKSELWHCVTSSQDIVFE